MDEAALKKIVETAKENGIDPKDLLSTIDTGNLPNELQDAIAAILGDVSTFGQALDKLDK